MRRRIAGIAAAIALVAVLAGCSASDGIAGGVVNGDENYASDDGAITEIAEADRGAAVPFESETTDGVAVSSDDYRGQVLVVNFWYAACPPCRVEAPDLQNLSEEFDGKGAAFLGVNVRDQAETAENVEDEWGITYPSVIDTNDGNMLLAFAGTVQPNAVPTTLVIDKKGRVAARILGQLEAPSILRTIINDTSKED